MKTLQETADAVFARHGVKLSTERVRQIERTALAKVRRVLERTMKMQIGDATEEAER